MKTYVAAESGSAFIDAKINELGDWRGKTFAKVRRIIHEADPEIVEEVKWMGTPVFSHAGMVCTGETYKSVVKLTFAKGASLRDPAKLFNSSLAGNVRRAIDIHQGDKINDAALKALIRAAVALNLVGKCKTRHGGRAASGTTDFVSGSSQSSLKGLGGAASAPLEWGATGRALDESASYRNRRGA